MSFPGDIMAALKYSAVESQNVNSIQCNYEMQFKLILFSLQKVKELTYMHSEGIMSGELKHGPLALVDNTMPVIMIVTRDPVYVVSIIFIDRFTCRLHILKSRYLTQVHNFFSDFGVSNS
jgi:glucosamine 6-phosphate synthetase-like amidotransferase/phosphosugar isomerase protein